MYFELSEMHVHNVTLESRQEAQNKRDLAHIVALQGQGQSAGIRLRHVRGGDDPLLWIPDAVLGALNSVHLGEEQYWEKLHEKVGLYDKKCVRIGGIDADKDIKTTHL